MNGLRNNRLRAQITKLQPTHSSQDRNQMKDEDGEEDRRKRKLSVMVKSRGAGRGEEKPNSDVNTEQPLLGPKRGRRPSIESRKLGNQSNTTPPTKLDHLRRCSSLCKKLYPPRAQLLLPAIPHARANQSCGR